MIILHNPHDAASRAFVAAHPEATVFDWYDESPGGGREQWFAHCKKVMPNWASTHGPNQVSAFPAVPIEVPSVSVDLGAGKVATVRRYHVLRQATTIDVIKTTQDIAEFVATSDVDAESLSAIQKTRLLVLATRYGKLKPTPQLEK
jgi:hypothetical protein